MFENLTLALANISYKNLRARIPCPENIAARLDQLLA